MISATSILATKPFSFFKNPNNSEINFDRNHRHRIKFDPKAVGLSIVVHLSDENEYQIDPGDSKKRQHGSNNLVLFGSQLKLQIPPQPGSKPVEFGIKTKNSKYEKNGPSIGPGLDNPDSTWISEMVLSEDYTCVIVRGEAVTKTTRIFGDFIVDSCLG